VRPLPETVILRGGGLQQHKLMQHMLVVGDYFYEQAIVGLSQEVVERRHVSPAEAALLAPTSVQCTRHFCDNVLCKFMIYTKLHQLYSLSAPPKLPYLFTN